ncbi:MAG TPA: exonuclease domain-containing protein [Beutenbergiaceae bacterium]|nr:exonuclease domain-containing protein [Beutenbergiaceae bacterium]
MSHLTTGPLLGFDTETTGVNPFQDRIVTAALVGRGPNGTEQRTWLIDPGVEIPEQAAAIHGVDTEHARAHGMQPAQALAEIAAELTAAFKHQIPVVAFNAAFDLTIIERELERHGLTTIGERLGAPLAPVVDPLVLDRALDRYRPGKRKLVDLCEVYGVADAGQLHTADVDVAATLDVLAKQAQRHPELSAQDLDQLHLWQAGQHRAWATGFNQWRQSKGLTGPGASLDWPLAREQEPAEPDTAPFEAAGSAPGAQPQRVA